MRGMVIEVHGMLATVLFEDGERLRVRPPRDRTPPIVGDRVRVGQESGQAQILEIAPRKRVFMRPHPRGPRLIASHVDHLFIVSATVPGPRPAFIDRVWSIADPDIAITIVLNKWDLEAHRDTLDALDDYAAAGADIIPTSAYTGEGIEKLQTKLRDGISVFFGHSGVGKSSLINALTGAELEVGKVNRVTAKGRHTTTTSTCHFLGPGQILVDTPGVRSFSMLGVSLETIALNFPGFSKDARQCYFVGCLHRQEPGCQVRENQDPARIARYEAFLEIITAEQSEGR